jgi:DNA-binding transcriptional ArsR family regulator
LRTAQGLEQLLPSFHGASARILSYVAAKEVATPEEISKSLKIPRSTVYKLLSEFSDSGLIVREKAGRVDKVSVPDFVFFIKNTAYFGELKITPRNVLAFDAAHTPAGKMFVEKYGQEKFAKFVELYDEYERGKTTSQLMARELGVIRYEIELLLSDINSMMPLAIQIGRHSHHRQ